MARADARRLAFNILRRVDRQGAWSSALLAALDADRIDQRDVALVTELVLGVLRRRLRLRQVLSAYSARPVDRIDPDALLLLELALYQMLYLTRVPAFAAVSEAVGLARAMRRGRAPDAAPFVNGILRAVGREPGRIPPPPSPGEGDPAPALSVAHSCPEWLVRRWLACFGRRITGEILEAQNLPAPACLQPVGERIASADLRDKLRDEGVETVASSWVPGILRVERGHPWRTKAFARGDFYIQDEASALVSRMVAAAPGDRVLDICAAPGGKSFEAASRAGETGIVVAADLHPARAALIQANAARMRLDRVAVLAADFSGDAVPFRPGALFDYVVVDAPCTGTGVIRRNPEIRYRVTESSLAGLVALQRRLLRSAVLRVRPGGALIYSVCSLEPEEGERQIAWLSGERPDLVADSGPLRTTPGPSGMDGFFAARLRRAG